MAFIQLQFRRGTAASWASANPTLAAGEMGVETEVTDKPLKRRRATATNAQGVVMLKGEWSFSSIDQILIDELVFYIQQN